MIVFHGANVALHTHQWPYCHCLLLQSYRLDQSIHPYMCSLLRFA